MICSLKGKNNYLNTDLAFSKLLLSYKSRITSRFLLFYWTPLTTGSLHRTLNRRGNSKIFPSYSLKRNPAFKAGFIHYNLIKKKEVDRYWIFQAMSLLVFTRNWFGSFNWYWIVWLIYQSTSGANIEQLIMQNKRRYTRSVYEIYVQLHFRNILYVIAGVFFAANQFVWYSAIANDELTCLFFCCCYDQSFWSFGIKFI